VAAKGAAPAESIPNQDDAIYENRVNNTAIGTPEAKEIAEPTTTESEALIKDLAEQKDLHLRLAADFETSSGAAARRLKPARSRKRRRSSLNCCQSSTISNEPWLLAPRATQRSFIRVLRYVEATSAVARAARCRE